MREEGLLCSANRGGEESGFNGVVGMGQGDCCSVLTAGFLFLPRRLQIRA